MDSPTGITAVAGYVGDSSDWIEVEEGWLTMLDANKLDQFRMSDIFHQHEASAAVRCSLAFAGILKDSNLHSVWAFMRDTDWSALDRNSKYARTYPRRQHACLDLLLTSLSHELDLEFKGRPSTVVFDNDYDKNTMADRVYKQWCANHNHPGFGEVSFRKGEQQWDKVPLQCADLLAGAIRRDPVTQADLNSFGGGHSFSLESISAVRLMAQAKGGRGNFWSIAVAKRVEAKLKTRRVSEAD